MIIKYLPTIFFIKQISFSDIFYNLEKKLIMPDSTESI